MLNNIISNSIDSVAPILNDVAREIHADPELGMNEFNAVKRQVELLKSWGFNVENPYCELDTAYRAEWGSSGPTFCFMSEYDALPEIGHACGHNLISVVALGAGKALVDILKERNIPGRVVVMGTPGEEGQGGKVTIINRGGLDDIDAAIMAHPSYKTAIWSGSFAVERYDVTFEGKAAHAAAAPEEGINALDAVMLLFHGINAWREHLPEATRIHGVVTNGGTFPNIVPETAEASFYLRAESQQQIEKMLKRFKQIIKGAALMTECNYILKSKEIGYKSGIPNNTLNDAFFNAASELNMNPDRPKLAWRASTDFGDVSHKIPGTHIYFGITEGGKETPLHTLEFAKNANSQYGIDQAIKIAKAITSVGYKFLTDDEFRNLVIKEFNGK
jgi:amidohydrolase